MSDMRYCIDFALANRKRMMSVVQDSLFEVAGSFLAVQEINIAHNYARLEHHFGSNVMVHRKGATSAQAGELGIIPGCQGSSSFIVQGRGNPASFKSCSHGAGRCMGRKQACRTLDLKEQQAILNDRDIVHSVKTVKDLDEAPGAYKDIYDVMSRQDDLVDIVTQLEPVAVVKG
jgi:tRNA-splicing ligase RtcB